MSDISDDINNVSYSCDDVEYSLDAILKKLEGENENNKKG